MPWRGTTATSQHIMATMSRRAQISSRSHATFISPHAPGNLHRQQPTLASKRRALHVPSLQGAQLHSWLKALGVLDRPKDHRCMHAGTSCAQSSQWAVVEGLLPHDVDTTTQYLPLGYCKGKLVVVSIVSSCVTAYISETDSPANEMRSRRGLRVLHNGSILKSSCFAQINKSAPSNAKMI